MTVVDASVLVNAFGDDTAAGSLARAALRRPRLAAPHVVDLEVMHVLRRRRHTGSLSAAGADRAIAALRRLAIDRHAHTPLLRRCWELRDNVTPYDAAYVALAEALGVPLLTADVRLANAPSIRCEVELLT